MAAARRVLTAVDASTTESDWESMKSESDVAKEQVLDRRHKLHFVVQRRLEDFGGSANFADLNATSPEGKAGSTEFAPYEDKSFSIHVTQLNKGCQMMSDFREVCCQTDVADVMNTWTQYAPRALSEAECSKIFQSTSMADFVLAVEPRLHEALEQAEIVDVFTDDLVTLGRHSNHEFMTLD